MKAIHVTRHGGPEVLLPADLPDPTPGPGEVLVRTTAIGVNYIDTYVREGVYPTELPYVPGEEGAGVVVATGPDVADVAAGDRVAWCQGPGSYAELVRVPAAALARVPDGVDDDVAASMLLQGLTAHYLVTDAHRATAGDPVLVHAAAGGVGQLLVQMAVDRGLTVIATASTPAKRDLVAGLGAHHVLSYEQATPEHVRELAGGGVSTVFDGVGRDTFDASLASLRPRGHLVLFGAASGPVPPVDPQRLNAAGSVFLTRPTLAHYLATPDEFAWRSGEVMDALVAGTLRLEVGARFALAEAVEAHRVLEARGTTGSVVLDPHR